MPKPRMKDFHDIGLLSQLFSCDDERLARAIAATFERRGTEVLVELPDALTSAFADAVIFDNGPTPCCIAN